MSFTLGRASLSSNPKTLDVDGRMVSFTFDLVATDVNHLTALRQQLAGLTGNGDEPEIPFTWSEDATLDGFYRNVQVTIPSTPVQLVSFFIQGCQVTMEQVTGFASPWWETSVQAIVRTNAHGITAPVTCMALIPGSAFDTEFDGRPSLITASVTGVATTISTPAGPVTGSRWFQAAPLTSTQYRYVVPVAKFYHGACALEVLYGSTWYTVVGRNVHVPPTVRAWRISNGVCRLTSSTGAALGKFEIYDPGAVAYVSCGDVVQGVGVNTIQIGGLASASAGDGSTYAVLRNDSERVTVKCSTASSAFGSSDFVYSLRRGERHVTIAISNTSASVATLNTPTNPGFTAFTGGGRLTANDANGNRIAFGATTAVSVSAGTVSTSAAATSHMMWVGAELDGSAATTKNTAADLVDQFIGSVSAAQRIIVR